jgi:hypothetical protein
MTRRILALIAGAALLVLVAMKTFGSVLVAPIGMWVAARIQRARGRGYTRVAGWVGAVLVSTLVMAGLFGYAVTRMPAGYLEEVQQATAQRQQERVQHPSAIEEALRRASTATPSQAMVQKKTDELAQSKAFIWWTMIVGGVLAAALAGLLLGSVGWAGATLVLFAFGRRARAVVLE